MKRVIPTIILFCYVFAFYIGGISVSLLIAVPLYCCVAFNVEYRKRFLELVHSKYLKNVFVAWFAVIVCSFLFPVIYFTFDYSFFRVMGAHFLHILAALPVLAYFKFCKYSRDELYRSFVLIFAIQTVIQCIVASNNTLGEAILYFNHFDPERVVGIGSGIRGKALSAATTYHLSLAYGAAFIVYVMQYLTARISVKNIALGLLIFVGIFYAGRTGFVGVAFGLAVFFLSSKIRVKQKLNFAAGLVITGLLIVILVKACMPAFYEFLEKQVIPYAFEFVYSKIDSGVAETASTNSLFRMWESDFNSFEILFGSGQYTGIDGKYYMHVDPGILRHTLFMGIIGYFVLLIYQLNLLPSWRMRGDTKIYLTVMLLYFFVMDFKGVTIGANKFVLSISLLLSYGYFFLPEKSSGRIATCGTSYPIHT